MTDVRDALKNMGFVSNKWYVGIPIPGHYDKHIAYKQKMYNDNLNRGDFERCIALVERPYRFQEFIDLMWEMNPKQRFDCLEYVWTDCESPYINIDVWKIVFEDESVQPYLKATLKDLPDQVVVYRGISNKSKKDTGISWTLSKKVAEKFANRWGGNGRVISKTVSKSDLKAYFNDRNEQEVIYWEEDTDEIL